VADDLLVERHGGSVNYAFHGIGLLTMVARGVEHEIGNDRLAAALQQAKGLRLDPSTINRQDNSLQGWSWIPQTFSWVEPTAWCLLALKKWSHVPGKSVDVARVREAEKLLLDRCCSGGGWNYGNSNMLGQELKPYVPTTAGALLSLQDQQNEPAVRRSTEYLERQASSEPSGVALSLAAMALRAVGRDTAAVRTALIEQVPTTIAMDSVLAAALTLSVLRMPASDAVLL
jgi:hypothetical protein